MRPPSKLIGQYGQDVWSIFSPLAVRLNAVNLGQGFPNFKMPQFMKQAATDAVSNDVNQYSPPKGLPRLRNALASRYSPLFNRQLDAENEIIVTAGANEGMLASFMAYLDPGTEVICFEPFFDQYAPNIEMCGAKMVCCPLRPPAITEGSSGQLLAAQWRIDFSELESKITERTRMIVLNTPHNPSGKVFDMDELTKLSEVSCGY
jgi:kynurenine aminotransferase